MKVTAWLQSARLPSQLYLGLALAAGWSLAARAGHPAPLALLVLLHAYGAAQQLFIGWSESRARPPAQANPALPAPHRVAHAYPAPQDTHRALPPTNVSDPAANPLRPPPPPPPLQTAT